MKNNNNNNSVQIKKAKLPLKMKRKLTDIEEVHSFRTATAQKHSKKVF
jgi:hypothetical protein